MSSKGGYRILAVVGPDLGRGFALAGVDVRTTRKATEALRMVREAQASREWGIIIAEEDLFAEVEARDMEVLTASTIPLLILLPGRMKWRDVEETRSDEFVARLIRRAVGYQLNIQL